MKIYDRDPTGAAAAEASRSAEAQKLGREGELAGRRPGGREGGDRVEFSDSMERLSRAISSYRAGQSSRVEALSALYQSGQYKVDAAAVSKSLVDDALSAGPEQQGGG